MNEYNNLLDLLKRRTSCRRFTDENVSEEDIQKIVEAGLWTASAHNNQSSKIIRVKNSGLRTILKMRTSQIMIGKIGFDPFYDAKELFLVVANGTCAQYDGSLTLGNMMLAATTLDLGSCWINTAQIESSTENSIIKEICNELGLPSDCVGIGYLIVGHPKENSLIKNRLDKRSFEI